MYENANGRNKAVATNDSIASTLRDRLVGLLLHTTQYEIKDFCASVNDLLLLAACVNLKLILVLKGGCGEAALFFVCRNFAICNNFHIYSGHIMVPGKFFVF